MISTTPDKICFVNAAVSACPDPHSFPCEQFVTGWNGEKCEKYSVASDGHCDASGGCISGLSKLARPSARDALGLRPCGLSSRRHVSSGRQFARLRNDFVDLLHRQSTAQLSGRGGNVQRARRLSNWQRRYAVQRRSAVHIGQLRRRHLL